MRGCRSVGTGRLLLRGHPGTTASLSQNHRTVGGPAQVDLIAPVDGPFERAAVVLGEDPDQLAGCGLDPVGGAIAEVPEFPHGALVLLDGLAEPAGSDRIFA